MKLARSPSLSAVIWWQAVQDTPSAASSAARVPTAPAGRCAKISPSCPAARDCVRAIGMWHTLHSSSMCARASGCSRISRRTPACQ
ncbi:MAG: hypothetical protein MUF60_11600 [Vicinamibacterales bacterium]|nr:hypothetical protein [Vicinamibacterales bacterium]